MSIKLEGRKYIEAVGRRKETSARVRLYELQKGEDVFFIINGEPASKFFDEFDLQYLEFPLQLTDLKGKYGISIQVRGGGITGWKDAIRLGLSRAIVKIDADLRPKLKKAGLLTRDARVVERKKPGLKKARKAPRWSKR